ncbi:diacylglycerol kinase family protein [Rhizosphaericola mali]|uniref:Diacylglycerol kinase family protein n=1 Tax=Rhizosphaericola mali TaxID=2545455 RepID=A0A5P2G303_9BACT|nr:diacylglycerol kinase family protein [Rhizosphaericola mali]QES88202.1 diacylglycerol kinase family protein [Rhizosphaericola mali]
MEKQPFSIRNRIKSFGYAFEGLQQFFKSEHNARVHLVAAIIAILLGIYLHISKLEWLILILTIAIVLMAEMFNTCIELIADHITKERHPHIKLIKDIAAGGVLITAIAAFIIGCIIFLPKL